MATANKHKQWTDADDEMLRKFAAGELDNVSSVHELAERLGRTQLSVNQRMRRIGTTNLRERWTEDELAIVRENIDTSLDELHEMLPGRSRAAVGTIRTKIRKQVGRCSKRPWTDEETSRLTDMLSGGAPISLAFGKFEGRSDASIRQMAWRLGYRHRSGTPELDDAALAELDTGMNELAERIGMSPIDCARAYIDTH